MGNDAVIKLRLPSRDRAAWLAAAAVERMTLSAWIHRRCDGRPAAAPEAVGDRQARGER
jgi:hypothetical protein